MTAPTPAEIRDLAAAVLEACKARGVMIATAESCTGGLIAGALTDIPGSSAVVDRGYVTYSNEAKTEMLGVPAEIIAAHGAVSEPVARAMAAGALARSRSALSVAVTGVAGPGGTPAKPEGMVWIATASALNAAAPPAISAALCTFGPIGRDAVRAAAVAQALKMIQVACDISAR